MHAILEHHILVDSHGKFRGHETLHYIQAQWETKMVNCVEKAEARLPAIHPSCPCYEYVQRHQQHRPSANASQHKYIILHTTRYLPFSIRAPLGVDLPDRCTHSHAIRVLLSPLLTQTITPSSYPPATPGAGPSKSTSSTLPFPSWDSLTRFPKYFLATSLSLFTLWRSSLFSPNC